MNLDELNKFVLNFKLDNNNKTDYIDKYQNLINNDKMLADTGKIIDIFNESIGKCIEKDNVFQTQLDNIQKNLNSLNTKFLYKNSLCKEYISKYNENKISTTNILELYNNNIINICIKNNEYNKMIQELLEEYNKKFEEYITNVNELYPKNFMIQIVINMIILTDMRNKSNILFKDILLDETLKQKNELNNTCELIKNNDLNKMIMNECLNMDELIETIEKKINIDMKEKDIENMINQL